MKDINCIIVDDELHSIRILTDHIQSIPNLKLIRTFQDPVVALAEIQKSDQADVIFIDIDMPRLSGLELAQHLKSRTKYIVFTTAFTRYAVEAFNVHAWQYLLKPIDQVKFTQTMMEITDDMDAYVTGEKAGFIFVKTGEKGKLTKIKLHSIIYLEALKNYVKLVTENETYVIYLTMNEVEEEFDNKIFMRVHRQFVVNTTKIVKVIGNTIDLGDQHLVIMGNYYKDKIIRYLESHTVKSSRY